MTDLAYGQGQAGVLSTYSLTATVLASCSQDINDHTYVNIELWDEQLRLGLKPCTSTGQLLVSASYDAAPVVGTTDPGWYLE